MIPTKDALGLVRKIVAFPRSEVCKHYVAAHILDLLGDPRQAHRARVVSDEAAVDWLEEKCRELGVEWGDLTAGQRFQLTMSVPCTIRCFRIGSSVDVAIGETCPECGKLNPLPSRYERILENG